jgi:hypothetical protein
VSAPAETIRAYLEQHGPVELRYDSLEETWQEGRLRPARRREVTAELSRAGILVEPAMERARSDEIVRVSLAPAATERRRLGWLVAVPLGLMALGALGPWAENIFATEQGIDGNGWVVLAAGAAGTLLLGLHLRRGRASPLPLVAALAGAAAAAVVAADFRDFLDDALVNPAWGLYVSFAGAALLVAVSTAALTRR